MYYIYISINKYIYNSHNKNDNKDNDRNKNDIHNNDCFKKEHGCTTRDDVTIQQL